MREVRCTACGSAAYEVRRTDYLYRRQGKYLLVPNTPVEVCLDCGAVYYDATVLKEIERHFQDIYAKTEEPDGYLEMPTKAFA